MHDISIIYPPQWSPFQPSLTLPTLAGWLRNKGYDVYCIDANIDFFHYLFSKETAIKLIDDLIRFKGDLDFYKKGAIETSLRNSTSIKDTIFELLQHNDDCLYANAGIVERSFIATKILSSYLNTISSLIEPISISPFNFYLSTSKEYRVKDIDLFLSKPSQLFYDFIDLILEDLNISFSKIVGISCVGYSQLPFALLLGKLIKKKYRKPVLIGGTILSRLADRASIPTHWFNEYFDIIVSNEGELPCEIILNNINANKEITDNVPNIFYLKNNTKIVTANYKQISAENYLMIEPDFSDVDFKKYFSPEIVLPILSSRGCYWGKCRFCTHSEVYGEKFTYLKVLELLSIIESLSTKYEVNNFCFNDEAIPPGLLKDIGNKFPSKKETGWSFSGIMRFEDNYSDETFARLYEKGFLSMHVGLESASERVLGLMRKSNKPSKKTIIKNLKNASNNGIFVNCFSFFGFPGETNKNAEETYEFIIQNSDIIGSFGTGKFLLEYGSPIFNCPDEYGIIIEKNNSGDISIWHEYKVRDGIDSIQAEEWSKKLIKDAIELDGYISSNFFQREHLLSLLKIGKDEFDKVCSELHEYNALPESVPVNKLLIFKKLSSKTDSKYYLLNIINGAVSIVSLKMYDIVSECIDKNVSARTMSNLYEPWRKFFNMQ